MNVLITGIAGSGGSYLAEYIYKLHPRANINGLARWHSTSHQDNLKEIRAGICVYECDMLDLPSLIRVLQQVKPDRIFNLASHANVRVAFDTPLAVLQNNMMATANLLEAIRLVCPETLLCHCSTSEIYGNPEQYPITEDHPVKPVNPYAVSKLCQENLVYAYYKSFNIRCVITRAFAYINPRRHELFSSAFAFQIARIESKKQDVLYHGNLNSLRTLIDVRDVMEAYWVACDSCLTGVPYNIGGNTVISVGEFLELLCKKAKVPIKCEQSKSLMRPTDITRQVPDVSRFYKQTGWQPKYSFEASVDFLLEYARKTVANEM